MTLTDEMLYGLMCISCRRNVRDGSADEVAVADHNGWTLVACRGACAVTVQDDPNGSAAMAQALPPLMERITRWEDDGDW